MLCPNCESVNRDGAKFCDECGFPLTGAIAARAAEAAAADTAEGRAADEEQVASTQIEGATEALEPLAAADVAAPAETTSEEPTEVPSEELREEFHDEPAAERPEEPAGEGSLYDEEIYAPGRYEVEDGPFAGEPETDVALPDATAAIGTDLAGLEKQADEYGERLVDADYQKPQPNWRDGNTMQMPRVEGDEAPRSKDYLASSATKQKTNKKVVVGVIVAVVAVAAIIAFATYQMQLWGGKAVPDVRGMTEADATSVLEDSGFAVRSTQVKSDDTEGLVLLMDPTAGSRAPEGEEVVIHIATARAIPSVVGKTEKQAKAAFEEEGYENVTYVNERSDEQEGMVLSVSPEAGTRAKSTVAVTVKVAEPYTVPDTASMSADGAIAAVQDAGLGYYVNYVDTQEYPEGTVLGTDPQAGAKVKSDTVVTINVARARGAQLIQLTQELLAPGAELTISGTNYIVNAVNSTSYLGNDQVSFTVTARPYTVFFGVYVEGDLQQVSGVVTFTADNQVSSIS